MHLARASQSAGYALALIVGVAALGCGGTPATGSTSAGSGGMSATSSGPGATTSSSGSGGGITISTSSAGTGGATGSAGTGGAASSSGTGGAAASSSTAAGTGGATSSSGTGGSDLCSVGTMQSCYTADPVTKNVGACKAGVQVCVTGGLWGPCTGEVTPVAESCNGADDDCDGAVDDGFAPVTCGIGACMVTVSPCVNGQPTACVPLTPGPVELCNGVDDNCNGTVDEGCMCTIGATQPCYTGPMATQHVGVCADGTQTCVAGQWGACMGDVLPSAEKCDGKDNDCDGAVDNGNPGGGATCASGKPGVCAVGTMTCAGGALVCVQNVQPGPEVCDGKDNDCDGVVDNGNPGGGLTCGTGQPGSCGTGATSCVNGAMVCKPANATPEVCDGIDNDCDGVIDNGNPGGGFACSTGKFGVCALGLATCTNGAVLCVQNTQPAVEVCDGKDNDCDGVVDNGNPGGGLACSTGKAGLCGAGTTACTGGTTVCNQNAQPTIEVCDGKDNNCDGQVDEGNPGGGAACNTGKAGVCGAGAVLCANGALGCAQSVQASAEICDGLDNNCDGQIDEGNPGGGTSCNTGKPGVCAVGTTFCGAATIHCVQNVQPGPEVCDGIDNNCDGQIDEGNPGGGAACNTGKLGVCAAGTVTCKNGALLCVQNVQPSAEVCDGLDNNCDGQIDEGTPGAGLQCNTGKLGVCQFGTTSCAGGVLACHQNVQPGPELCDGLDNNCNGQVDEGNPGGGTACNTGKFGVCAAGTGACTGGALSCLQNVQPSAELCDGLDNNCDGQVDEGNPGVGAACSTGKFGVCAAGTVSACLNGAPVCSQTTQPSTEVCDGKDNNCNGQVDENTCSCTHNRCTTGTVLVSGCDAPPGFPSCVQKICATDSYCCVTAWDSVCIGEVNSICGITPCY